MMPFMSRYKLSKSGNLLRRDILIDQRKALLAVQETKLTTEGGSARTKHGDLD